MQKLAEVIEQAATRRWPLGVALAGQLASFRLLRAIGTRFQRQTAQHEPFDFQNGLTVAAMQEQLVAYTPLSKVLYRQFFVTDFCFPLLGSTFLGLLWATLLQYRSRWGRWLLRWHAPLWPFVPTLWDWAENVCFLIVIERYPNWQPGWAALGVACKRLKLLTLAVTFGGSATLLGATSFDWLWQRLRSYRGR